MGICKSSLRTFFIRDSSFYLLVYGSHKTHYEIMRHTRCVHEKMHMQCVSGIVLKRQIKNREKKKTSNSQPPMVRHLFCYPIVLCRKHHVWALGLCCVKVEKE